MNPNMNATITVINDNVRLKHEKILIYLKPEGPSIDWTSVAWQSCAPWQGEAITLKPINNEISAYAIYGYDRGKTAIKKIPPQHMSTISEAGNVISFGEPVYNTEELTPDASGISNMTLLEDLYPVWCLNGESVCKPKYPMLNTGINSFRLLPKIYFTIGSEIKTETFHIENWTRFTKFDVPENLVSADVHVSMDLALNKPFFSMQNMVYS